MPQSRLHGASNMTRHAPRHASFGAREQGRAGSASSLTAAAPAREGGGGGEQRVDMTATPGLSHHRAVKHAQPPQSRHQGIAMKQLGGAKVEAGGEASSPNSTDARLAAVRRRGLAAGGHNPSFAVLAAGVFVFYIVHDALQERLFRTPGFTFGSFMTVAELAAMAFGSMLSRCTGGDTANEDVTASRGGRGWLPPLPVLAMNIALVVLITISQNSGSQALNYVNFPVKVCFKSAKVLPTMAFSIFITGRRYPLIQYVAALCLVAALMLLSLADYHADEPTVADGEVITHTAAEMMTGMQLLALATIADAIVPNIQERILSKMKTPLDEMIFWSNVGALVLLGAITLVSGEFASALHFCAVESPASGLYLSMQALSAYLGLRLYLTIVKQFGGVVGVMTTSARKGVTLILSYALFRKPLSLQHVAGVGSLLLGLYLSAVAKKKKPHKHVVKT